MCRKITFLLVLLLPFTGPRLLGQEPEKNNVVLRIDARLAVLVRKTHTYVKPITHEDPKPAPIVPSAPAYDTYTGSSGLVHQVKNASYTGRGFRVQIYNGPSREKALSVKAEFMRHHPGVSTYIMYVSPGFRVKIGDYRNRSDAEGMLREANSMYSSPSMIVPDIVTVSNY
jgi:hypothetical protein